MSEVEGERLKAKGLQYAQDGLWATFSADHNIDKERVMKVIYDDPDGRKGTYHPVLGYMVSGVPFELPDEVAKRYVKSRLLKAQSAEAESSKGKAERSKVKTENTEGQSSKD